MPRFFCPALLRTGDVLDLPAGAARHVQVLRLQPGDSITLFNHGPGGEATGPGGEFEARVTLMGRSQVQVEIGAHANIEREPQRAVHLAVGMPANERMDWLVEKAAELGVASIQPLMTERSVLRLAAERATKKVEHWQSVAIAACEQCGGNRVPTVHAVKTLTQWLGSLNLTQAGAPKAMLLSLGEGTQALRGLELEASTALFLSGPEGGLSRNEESAAMVAGFVPVTLGPRVLRSETAALTALALLV
jgi:16S rRNA (uracil1498-N3)-methyltransferase